MQEVELEVPLAMTKQLFRNPLSVCTFYESYDVLALLLEHGVTVEKADCRGNNVFHLLVFRSLFRYSEETITMSIYSHLLSHLPAKTICNLLRAENNAGTTLALVAINLLCIMGITSSSNDQMK